MSSMSGFGPGAHQYVGLAQAKESNASAPTGSQYSRLSDTERDRLNSDLKVAQTKHEAARAALALAKGKLDRADANLKGATEANREQLQKAFDDARTAHNTANQEFHDTKSKLRSVMEQLMPNSNFIDRLFDKFERATVSEKGGVPKSFHEHLNDKIDDLGDGDSSDPQKLARYQKAIMMFTVHTNAQSSMIKSISDLDKGIVRDFN